MKILLFGMLADKIGKPVIETEAMKDTLAMKRHLLATFPELRSLQFRLVVNQETAADDLLLNEEDEIALLPPFAGG